LVVDARNEYGGSDRTALALYGLDLVVEPYRETSLSVEFADPASAVASGDDPRFYWHLAMSNHDGSVIEGVDPELDGEYGKEVLVTLRGPGNVYRLTVRYNTEEGTEVERAETPASVSLLVTCKYVRRELRKLTDQDLEDFLFAMSVFYELAEPDASLKYGPDFVTYKFITAVHNSQ
ncbi:unnamed protein product, partial [Choristocarpus tenellus]